MVRPTPQFTNTYRYRYFWPAPIPIPSTDTDTRTYLTTTVETPKPKRRGMKSGIEWKRPELCTANNKRDIAFKVSENYKILLKDSGIITHVYSVHKFGFICI